MISDEYMNGTGSMLQSEIEKAIQLNERFGLILLNDPESSRLLRKLRDLVRRTDSAMLQSGVVSACARCANDKGSCCFKEMGESYGAVGLFINMLLGSVFNEESEITEKTDLPGSCHFVGSSGCKLFARQSFCLNYFCPDLKNSVDEDTILGIQRSVGQQLLAGWELERVLARYMADADRQTHI
ncbi:conserved hypothetical protein [Syntrophobacter sp. SbD1]|nr:conserved hypothetical protein [Syntrophobacter sp. SbD1]